MPSFSRREIALTALLSSPGFSGGNLNRINHFERQIF